MNVKNPDIEKKNGTFDLLGFDFMVDDGLHNFDAGITLFKNSISKLSKNGIYVIEDVKIDEIPLYRNFFDRNEYNVDYVALKQPNLIKGFIVIIRQKEIFN